MTSETVNVSGGYALGPLMPLVRAGYKSLAARAVDGVNAWHSGLASEARAVIDGKLAELNLNIPGSRPAPKLYVVTGGAVWQRTLPGSSSLLEDAVNSVLAELSALASTGNIAGVNPASFDRLFFSFDYSIFKRALTADETLQIALTIAVSYYGANEGGEFVNQLDKLGRAGGIRVATQLQAQGFDYRDEQLTLLAFKVTTGAPSVLNIINSLRLLYLAADHVLARSNEDLSGLRQKLVAAANAQDPSFSVPKAYSAGDSNLQAVAELLGKVSLHKGVEALIAKCNEPVPNWKEALGLAKLLETVVTGKAALDDNDKPYSNAIGLAELIL